MNKLQDAIENVKQIMIEENIDPTKGLPEELFLFATMLMPCANVDLFVTDENNRVLLSWRDDKLFGSGWHIPGGCIRLQESMEHRVQETAKKEIGSEVIFDKSNYILRESFSKNYRPTNLDHLVRSHGICILYYCKLPNGFVIDNNGLKENDAGFLKWFDEIPQNIIESHKKLYGPNLEVCFERLKD